MEADGHDKGGGSRASLEPLLLCLDPSDLRLGCRRSSFGSRRVSPLGGEQTHCWPATGVDSLCGVSAEHEAVDAVAVDPPAVVELDALIVGDEWLSAVRTHL